MKKLNAVSEIMPILFIATVGIGLINAKPSYASFADFGGGKTASWKEPSKITIYIPNGLMGDGRMNFEMGINSWINMLPQITVMFMDGMHPADVTENFIDVKLVDMLPPGGSGVESGFTLINANFPEGETHGMITDATISILNSALGQPIFLKNLGAHEFGHALGLDDDPRADGVRVNVMDPDFKPNDPFISPTDRDKMMAREHYTVSKGCVDKSSSLKPFTIAYISNIISSAFIAPAYAQITPPVCQVPEPNSTLSLLALGTLGAGATLKRKLKPSKIEKVG